MGTIIEDSYGLSTAELEGQQALQLPARHLMALVDINLSIVNAVQIPLAMNVLTDGSSAASSAVLQLSVGQF